MKTTFVVCAVLLAATALMADLTTYTYDSAGRVIAVHYGTGTTTTYQYDATGNLLRFADTLNADSDNDGMADSWELSFFGGLSRDGLGDFDSDGMPDVAEFLAGTLPNDPNSVLQLSRNVTVTQTTTTLQWSAVAGKVYRVQYKDSLSDPGWNDLPGDVTATGGTASQIDTTVTSGPQRFYRVQLVR
ncbi:MAG: hypothetical protein DME24_22365 [Verrucomicrobia bacterium]|nr:MAG: hypothetical protein DME24_22365 [Verrucomicrobiota bacterium]